MQKCCLEVVPINTKDKKLFLANIFFNYCYSKIKYKVMQLLEAFYCKTWFYRLTLTTATIILCPKFKVKC